MMNGNITNQTCNAYSPSKQSELSEYSLFIFASVQNTFSLQKLIANNLKLQIKRQQMDYGNTQRCDLLYTAGITAASCGGEYSRHTWLLRVCFPELTVVFQEHMLPHSTFW